ncbi:aspartate aminotransferase [Schizosaccharomyces cryophilus OY26]|uniref:aspartate transaminase n=1 Tax=Schizosaccharomyces cryophilus (strain OY26 / ATCC MYA-4695 / CBS 11777 / NBRC 106824 / NRRL Y48691) TaxID=653667 RepID=S9VSL0_SCHCR|nr:aspartate aminotransferase [Schizosaccharomyces cryophilus OY26]EPY50868.1 aspartate aminotransferase [Schizosaccharomyces cryophilus OY26]
MSDFGFTELIEAQPDAIFRLNSLYSQDEDPSKVNMSIGAYRDDTGRPWILPVVKKATEIVEKDPNFNHEYMPIAGYGRFTKGAAEILFKPNEQLLKEDRICSIQSVSGTGANFTAARFLAEHYVRKSGAAVYISNPTWPVHRTIWESVNVKVETYPYWDAKNRRFDFEGTMDVMKSASEGSIFLLHACAHNPTGMDPTREQWKSMFEVLLARKHLVVFDIAYQGFASGDLDRDSWALNEFAKFDRDFFVCQSFAKNMGLYGERTGCLHYVAKNNDVKSKMQSVLCLIQRSTISNPPAYGARIAAEILNNPELFEQWKGDLRTMSSRINEMRRHLRDSLVALKTPGTWDHITEQIGMFSYTGLTPAQVQFCQEKYHLYFSANGRISMAGLNSSNVDHVAKAFDHAVREVN